MGKPGGGRTAMVAVWLLLLRLSLAGAPRPFDGTYTIVNKANGRRMFASTQAGLFVVDDSGPIFNDQMWVFSAQENQSYAIINAANGMRVLAQSTSDDASGFFAMDHGPIYQDQRWYLSPQSDGSYVIVNVKSGRRILAKIDEVGKLRFAAISGEGHVQPDETWWIINQERDETARFMAELDAERAKVVRLTASTSAVKTESEQLMQRLRSALDTQTKLQQESATLKRDTLSAASQLQADRAAKAQLAKDVAAHQSELARLRAELSVEQSSKEQLLTEVKTHQGARMKHELELESARAAQSSITEKLQASGSKAVRLETQLQVVESAKGKLIDTLSDMHSQVARLSVQLNITSVSNMELTSRVNNFEARPPCWVPNFHLDMSKKLLGSILTIVAFVLLASCARQHVGLMSEVRGKRKRISILEQELQAEFGDMVCVGDCDGGLGSDFGFCVFNTEISQESVRLIKVQCPGVKHSDVEIELIFNGCEVTIRRQASRGVACAIWKRRFQFKPSDGLFEFREEQMCLEDGFLQLVFRACAFQKRRVLFPRHFNLSETDADTCWDYQEEGDDVDAWWNESPDPQTTAQAVNKTGSQADVDTESTASTARVLV